MSGVWLFESRVPFCSMNCSRWGISSRSDGTLGLSRKKCTLSKVISKTCFTPLPNVQLDVGATVGASFAIVAAGAATCQPIATAATTKSLISLLISNPPQNKALATRGATPALQDIIQPPLSPG